jgi:hypothetical protein
MLPRNTFNVADWALRETPAGLVLRPTLYHALAFRLLFGTGSMAVFTMVPIIIDTQLTSMENARRVSEADMQVLTRDPDPRIKPLLAAGRQAEAQQIQKEVDARIGKYVQEHEAEYVAMREEHRPWHLIARILGAITVFFGIYFPLSPLWQRVRLTRDGQDLVVRKNIFPKTRRIPITAVQQAEIWRVFEDEVTHLDREKISSYWQIVLEESGVSLVMYLAVGAPVDGKPPARAMAFVEALKRLAG